MSRPLLKSVCFFLTLVKLIKFFKLHIKEIYLYWGHSLSQHPSEAKMWRLVLASVTSWLLTAEYFTIRLLLTRLLIHRPVLPPFPTCSFIPSSCYLPCTLLRPWLCITHCGESNGWEPLLSKRGSWRHAYKWWIMLDSNKLCISEGGNIGAQRGVRYMWEVLIPRGVNAQGPEVWAGRVRFKEEGGYKEERIEWSWGQLISKPPRGGYGKDQQRWKLAQISSVSSTYTTTFQMFNNTIKNISWHLGMAK